MSCHAMPWRVRVMHVERTVHDMYNQKPPEQTPNAATDKQPWDNRPCLTGHGSIED